MDLPEDNWKCTGLAFARMAVGVALCLIPCLYMAFFIQRIVVHPKQYLWDFQANYYWTKAFLHGLNPYDVNTATSLMGSLTGYWPPAFEESTRPPFPLLYTPLSMLFFAPFTLLNYETARMIALGFYILVLLSTLIIISRRLLDKSDFRGLFCLFAVLAFNGGINKSIMTGNVNSLETALIFMALLCWLKEKHSWFICFILLASIFKLTLLFFLGLTFFDKTPRWWAVAIILAGFLLLVAISFWVPLVSLPEWLPFARSQVGLCHNLTSGFVNPTIACMLRELLVRAGSSSVSSSLRATVFVLFVAAVLFLTSRTGLYLGQVRESHDASRCDLVAMAILGYALVLPRVQEYAWVLLIPAVFRVLMTKEYAKTMGPLMVLCLLPHREDTFPGLNLLFKVAAVYSPAIVALAAWLLLVLNIGKHQSQDNMPA